MGVKSEDNSRLGLRKYARIIRRPDLDTESLDFKIQNNPAGSHDVKFPICLEVLAYTQGQSSSYGPHNFRTNHIYGGITRGWPASVESQDLHNTVVSVIFRRVVANAYPLRIL